MSPIELIDTNGPILGLLGVITTLVANYIINKKKLKLSEQTADRDILSKDQKDFKDSLLKELNECRETVDHLKNENDRLRNLAIDVRSDKEKLSIEIMELNHEIIKLKEQLEFILNKIN